MPPKKEAPKTSKKAEVKKKEKVVEDKTFGLKNKKGAQTQKFIQHVKKSVDQPGVKKAPEIPKGSKKEEKKKELDELNAIFRPVATQKVKMGVDPKSVLCAFFKQGQCTKGEKCKFSHDVNIERKSEKRSAYCDLRDGDEEDNMENWDEAKLMEVVEKKHGEIERKMPKTDIICKHFLEALELNKYGWFWECPNGGLKCHYKHALPPGFVLNKDRKKMDKKEDISIEDLVERERAKLGGDLLRITLETFLAWKRNKIKEKLARDAQDHDRKQAEFKAGKHIGLSGRDMFTFNPELITGDLMGDDEAAFDSNLRDNDEDAEEGGVTEISLEALAQQAREVDGSGTQVTSRLFQVEEKKRAKAKEEAETAAAGGSAPEAGVSLDTVPIDENLFDEDDEDLDELEQELSALNVE